MFYCMFDQINAALINIWKIIFSKTYSFEQ